MCEITRRQKRLAKPRAKTLAYKKELKELQKLIIQDLKKTVDIKVNLL